MSRGLSAPEKLSDCVARRAYVVRIRCGSTEMQVQFDRAVLRAR